MLETKQAEIYKEKWFNWLSLSIWFLIVIILLTVSLFAYNTYIEWKNTYLEKQITEKEKAIKEKQKNQLIQVYDLYTRNKSIIKKLEKQSDIVSTINHLDEIALKYNIELSGFDYSAWEIKTKALSSSDWWSTLWSSSSYKKTYDFIKKYREDNKNPYKLSFIESFTMNKNVSGNEEWTFNLSLKSK